MYNKANRVNFEQSSPNGILLFRTTSAAVCAYGNNSLGFHSQNQVPENEVRACESRRTSQTVTSNSSLRLSQVYKLKYKGYSLALDVLVAALSGNYVCFGVFQLYQDPALDQALDVALRLSLSISLDDVMAYPKLSKSYFSFLEVLFRSHISVVLKLNTDTLMQVLNSVHEGLQSSDAPLSSICASTVDHLATFYFNNAGKQKEEARR